ncbi:metallophosphoesterase [Arthrobacter echini]|uniref:Phosphoesterase n=1 Tax=Arthrobacter echini TaxID=1529066 RepID=A0A4S5E5F9_9MICC|nr:metallophosphoesterase [Arthrobacter echini]THJ66670.1 metallophosphoesterase [Arthrobacter echini]
MSLTLTILADTHLPKRAKALPGSVWEAVDAADVVVHAGDWTEPDLLEQVQGRAAHLVACYGNNDGPVLGARLPQVARDELDGVRLAVVHETGPARGREARMAGLYPDVDVLVFGHSHIPWDTRADSGLRLLNPGSPTDRRRQPFCTFMTAVIDAGELAVTLHRLPRRVPRT